MESQLMSAHPTTGANPGPYGTDLSVRVSKPSNATSLLVVDFSFDIECSNDHVLLVYTLRNGAWRRLMRWQAPPLKGISDAFGDFFVWTMLTGSGGADSEEAILVARYCGGGNCSRIGGRLFLLPPSGQAHR